MYQTFSDNLQQNHPAEALTESRITLTGSGTARNGDGLIRPPRPRKIWAASQRAGDAALKWQRVFLIQHVKDKGFAQAPIRAGLGSVRSGSIEKYKGHVLDVLIEVSLTERIGTTVHNILLECYPSTVPAPDTLHYTLGEFPRNLVWNQGQAPEHILDMDVLAGREMILSDTDKLGSQRKTPPFLFFFLPSTPIGPNHLNPP